MPDLAAMLDGLAAAGRKEKEVPVRHIRDVVGRRSFAPLLLVVSLFGFTPLGSVPGIPTLLAVFVILIAAQILVGCESLWLPKVLLDRKVEGEKLTQAAKSLRPAARWIDRVLRPRLEFLTLRPSSYVIALVCIFIALTVPPLELIPFVDLPLWAALVAFSLALATHDGLLAIAAFILTATGVALTAMALW
jgi:hypothetical protein